MTDARSTLKDAAYVGIGFAVLAFQKAQVQRQELQKRFEAGVGDAKGGFDKLSEDLQDRIKLVEERIEALGKQVDATIDDLDERYEKVLDQVAERLPEQAKELFGKARTAGKDARTQVRELARNAAPKAKDTAAA